MEILKDKHFITKSIWCVGKRLEHCFNCVYCRESDNQTKGFNIDTTPSEINPMLNKIPVAINLFYGDPLMQIDNTLRLINKLESSKHKGPVIIITKGDFSKFPDINTKLDLHFAFSTFGKNHILDGGNTSQFIANIHRASEVKKYKYSIELRPIIYQINDDKSIIKDILDIAKRSKISVGFSGLQGKPGVIDNWRERGFDLKPFPGTNFGYSKPLPDYILDYFYSSNQPVFKKTSCLISYTHNMDRDYNAHYYRPNEVGCMFCKMKDKCDIFYKKLPNVDIPQIPFDYEIAYEAKHTCAWLHKGCSFPTEDCKKLCGYFIKINQKLTTSDVRMIKWLTGMTVIADFEEIPYLSNNWLY